ncbi:phage tail protein [Pseudomonas sp. CCI2.4]|uniref:phage tail protein n=1 Tax=Pseudomonas sp. CCI2.4 TaxID=3048617 RepID=UPI002B22B0A5|nr:phage tail protein [Pseudomonas sp. CCI2.4]MEB0133523.1 phage tail protein [Pseudomonas sp. CCI2.4]
MNDLNHYVGGDLSLSPTGGLSPVFGLDRGKQRVLRRLITNPGDYLFHTEYGAGLGQYVGALMNIPQIIALIRGQILLEDCVAATPKPAISVSSQNDTLSVSIGYTDAPSGEPLTLSFEVNR